MMKINFNSVPFATRKPTFKDVSIGEFFMFLESNNDIFLKTSSHKYFSLSEKGLHEVTHPYLKMEQAVEILNAELNLTKKEYWYE